MLSPCRPGMIGEGFLNKKESFHQEGREGFLFSYYDFTLDILRTQNTLGFSFNDEATNFDFAKNVLKERKKQGKFRS